MTQPPYEDTALWLALESSLNDLPAPNTTDMSVEDIKGRTRKIFIEAMNENLAKYSHPARTACVRSKVDHTGEFPAYRIENGRAQVFLKNAEVTLTSELENNQETVHADFVKMDIFPRSQKFDL